MFEIILAITVMMASGYYFYKKKNRNDEQDLCMVTKLNAIKAKDFSMEIKKIVKKHKEVVVIFNNDGDLRKRLIKADGSCTVAYKGSSYKKWSSFGACCFMSYTENYRNWDGSFVRKAKKKTLNNTIKALMNHDREDGSIVPVQITYGKEFKKSIYIIKDWT